MALWNITYDNDGNGGFSEWLTVSNNQDCYARVRGADESAYRWAHLFAASESLLEACKPCLKDYTVIWREANGEIHSSNPIDYDKGERFEVYLTRAEMDAIRDVIAAAEPERKTI